MAVAIATFVVCVPFDERLSVCVSVYQDRVEGRNGWQHGGHRVLDHRLDLQHRRQLVGGFQGPRRASPPRVCAQLRARAKPLLVMAALRPLPRSGSAQPEGVRPLLAGPQARVQLAHNRSLLGA